jgi:hypothetical protein
VFAVRYELGFYISEDGILHGQVTVQMFALSLFEFPGQDL